MGFNVVSKWTSWAGFVIIASHVKDAFSFLKSVTQKTGCALSRIGGRTTSTRRHTIILAHEILVEEHSSITVKAAEGGA